MKRMFLTLLLFTGILAADSSIVSSIPLPKTYVQNLDPYGCDETCLAQLISHEQVFSFLAQMPEPVEDAMLNEQRLIYVALFNLDSGEQGAGIRIALLLPEKVIGRYAFSTTNSVTAYLLGKNRRFELKTFQIGDESEAAVKTGLQRIAFEKFNYVIAPMTKTGANRVAALHPPFHVYFPTVNSKDVNASGETLYFGGIDYRAQINLLMRDATPPLVIFYDESELGKQLRDETKTAFLLLFQNAGVQDILAMEKQIHAYPVDKHTTNLKSVLYKNGKIKNGTVFLNTPLVKSGMIMSQLTLYDVNASGVLSTQINFDPLLFDITQPQDRANMLIANAIGPQNSVLVERNKLLQNDIVFDWINYATTVGMDYFYHRVSGSPREYGVPIVNNQVRYPLELFRTYRSRFEPYAYFDDEYDQESSGIE